MLARALATLFTRSLESPQVPLTGANIGAILGGGRASSAGVSVTKDTAMGHPAIFRGCNLIANGVSRAPVFVYKEQDGNRTPHTQSPAWRLLRWRANERPTRAHTFLKTMIGHALLHRGGYAWITRTGGGLPAQLYWLDPSVTYPYLANGRLLYNARSDDGSDMRLTADSVLHIRGLGWDGLDGWSVIDSLKEAIGLGLAAQKFTSVYFRNNAQPRVILKVPGYLSDEALERLRSTWGAMHQGVDNAHKPAILEGETDVIPFQTSNDDAQLMSLREFDLRTIGNVLGVPPHMLGDDSRTSFASLEQENQRFLDEALDPWMREIETETADKLLPEEEARSGRQVVEYRRAAFVRADLAARMEAYTQGILGGFMSRAQVRRLENWNVDDPELEKYLQPLNMVEAGADSQDTPLEGGADDTPSEEGERVSQVLGAYREMAHAALREVAERSAARISRDLERLAKSPSKTSAGLDSFVERHASALEASLVPFAGPEAEGLIVTILEDCVTEARQIHGQVPGSEAGEALQQLATNLALELPGRIIERGKTHLERAERCGVA